jgi:hypothetical protein
MDRYEKGEARVIPIILRACDWQDAPFGKLQALPKDAQSVASWSNRDEAFLNIEQGIKETVLEVLNQKLRNQVNSQPANAEAPKQQMDRWKMLEDTQTKIFEIQQDITVNKRHAANELYHKYDKYIRG